MEKENMELAAPEKKSLERFILKKGEVKIVDDKPKKENEQPIKPE